MYLFYATVTINVTNELKIDVQKGIEMKQRQGSLGFFARKGMVRIEIGF